MKIIRANERFSFSVKGRKPMKKYLGIIIMLVVLVNLTSCASSEISINNTTPVFLDVELVVTPELAKPNELITFQAKVTYGDERVTDADKVTFDIWNAKDEKREKIVVKHDREGIYQLKKSFATEGTYYIISHVTARDMHYMPKKQFTVGQPSEPSEPDQNHAEPMDMEDH